MKTALPSNRRRVAALALVLAAAKTAESFTVVPLARSATTNFNPSTSTTAPRRPATASSTSLLAGFAATNDYLSGLSLDATGDSARSLSSTEDYLAGLARFVDYTTTTAASWERPLGGQVVEGQWQEEQWQSQPLGWAEQAGADHLQHNIALSQALPQVRLPEADLGGGIANAGGDSVVGSSRLMQELSGMSYNTIKDSVPGAGSKAAKAAAEFTSGANFDTLVVDGTVSPGPRGAEQLSHGLSGSGSNGGFSLPDIDVSGVSERVSEFSSGAGANLEAAARVLARAVVSARDASAAELSKSFDSLQAGKAHLLDRGSEAMQGTAELQVAELGRTVAGGLEKVGSLFLQALTAAFEAATGSNAGDILASARGSVSALLDGAVHQVVGIIQHIGDMSVAQVAQILATIVVTVLTTLWKIFNAIVGVVSGRAASEWAIAASKTVDHEASQLTAKAVGAAHDFSERSLSELVGMTGHFMHESTDLLAQGLHGITASLAVGDAVGDAAAASVGGLASGALQLF